ncbi:MAG: hypothetical protein IJU08_00595 [Bacteroidales bacterium]|nr:hypothetical protein [Bacteroidales bacterium]
MESSFNLKEYIRYLGRELVSEFEKAGIMTHPGAVGSGRETSAKQKLKQILPAGVGVGSGFVIDSFGHTSRQCDIILYEENFALRVSPNLDTENTYYNCESVIAVGEVKSIVTRKELEDSLDKLSIIKGLQRKDDGNSLRNYLSSQAIMETFEESRPYEPKADAKKQIFTFLLCQSFNMTTEMIVSVLKERCSEDWQYPNRMISTEGAYYGYLRLGNPIQILCGRKDATSLFNFVDNFMSFNYFILELLSFISNANTVALDYSPYLGVNLTSADLKEIAPL